MAEILAPAGDKLSAYAAINSGADAIYLGLTSFSARSSAENFDLSSLKEVISYAHFFGVKIYVAMNTLIKQAEAAEFLSNAAEVWNVGADAIIVQDLYLGAYLKKCCPDIILHLSTQAGVCNEYGARYAKELGFSRVILARETKFEDIKKIAGIIETEVFVQGALCTCFSGQCYLSSFAGGNSGNRGRCKQPCRKRYKIDRAGYESYAYRISLSDLCLGEDIKKYEEAGVSSFKIEGRMRRPQYVAAAVSYYKKLLSNEDAKSAFSALKRAYNRGNYTKGLAFFQEKSFISSAVQGHIGEFVGTIFVESGKFVVKCNESFSLGDGFKILREGKELCGAKYGGDVKGGFYLNSSVRLKNGDKCFITTDFSEEERLMKIKRAEKAVVSVYISAGENPVAVVNGMRYTADFAAEKALGKPINEDDIRRCFLKIDGYPYEVEFGEISISGEVFIPVSGLNAFRRQAFLNYFESRQKVVDKILQAPAAPAPFKGGKNTAVCVIAENLNGVKADIGVLKPAVYGADIFNGIKDFKGEKFLYLPPYLTGAEIEKIKPLITPFDGIYCGGNYSVPLCKEFNKKLFAGAGFNLSNAADISFCPADYKVISKEFTIGEASPLADKNTFFLSGGDIKVMDLIYCPFSKNCRGCDKRFYTLCDEDGREFILRRYKLSECRYELFNCARLKSNAAFTGILIENTVSENFYTAFTKGHTEKPVL